MIDLVHMSMEIEPDALDQLPSDWSEQLDRGIRANYLVGYDSLLDEAYVWFDSNREHAVHIPLNSLLDIVIDDQTEAVIGFVARKFAQILLALYPQSGRAMVRDLHSDELRLPDDIAMTPIQQFSSVIPRDMVQRTLERAAHLAAA